ncbi:MAG: hypothetical protein ACRC0Y_05535 [Fusobacteriaceae bacterium]
MFSKTNVEEKQRRFFEDKNEFRKIATALTISDMEDSLISNTQNNLQEISNKTGIVPSKEMIDAVILCLPSRAKALKSMPKTISDAIFEYGLQRVVQVAKYIKKNKVEKIRAYFLKALKENWEIEIEKVVVKEIKNNTENEFVKIEQYTSVEKEQALIYFNSLADKRKIELEEKVYSEYIKECGSNTKIQKIAFKAAKNNLISIYILKNPRVKTNIKIEEVNVIEPEIIIKNNMSSLSNFKKYAEDTIQTFKFLFELTDIQVKKLQKNVYFKITPMMLSKELTKEKISKLVQEEIENM